MFAGDAGADTGELPATNPGGSTPTPTPTPSPSVPSGTVNEAATVAALQRAQQAFTDADSALRNGDLATYQSKTNEAKQALADALRQMGR